MPIKSFQIRKEVLVNTGNYENTKVSHEITYQIDGEESINEIDYIECIVTQRIDAYLQRQINKLKR